MKEVEEVDGRITREGKMRKNKKHRPFILKQSRDEVMGYINDFS